eukprot:CAMPEP_0185744506 /NCGR_PEP_ID=MMETSP1174-20130828/2644_1 /TAXON_ID=35687 /ORGANISM="Dictyocha speculum, Strain CCMP1381" /LENGTH=658 /DNA_ID=CAMNT_0028417963 /DNA_START=14 /DNA_END=1990 /DNA_ORIENTATION=+
MLRTAAAVVSSATVGQYAYHARSDDVKYSSSSNVARHALAKTTTPKPYLQSEEPPKILATSIQSLKYNEPANTALLTHRLACFNRVKGTPRLPELDYVPTAKYCESSKEEILYTLIDKNQCIMVPGAYFGDEGKGKTVDAIARHPDVKVVARVNSGENAGHTVIGENGVKYAFHLCPSGLLTPGKINVIGPECVMDPVSFMKREIGQLIETGVPYKDRLFIGDVHLVCPHHKLQDLMGSWSAPNASTLQGMAPIHGSKAQRKGIRLDHLFNDRVNARKRLEADMVAYYGMLKVLNITEDQLYYKAKQNNKIQKHVIDFILAKDKAGYVLDLYDEHVVNNPEFPPRRDVSHLLRKTIESGEKVLLEGPQSYWLSNAAEKFWDSGTSANTGASGMLAASQLNVTNLNPLVVNIHKTPGTSRVGAGANPCAFVPQNYFSEVNAKKNDFDDMLISWRDVSSQYFNSVQPNGLVEPGLYTTTTGTYDLGVAMAAASCIHPSHQEFGVTSGRPRVVGFFDCVAQAELISAQGPYCSISAFDRGDDYDEYGVCVAYVYSHPEGRSMVSNGRTFESGCIIRAGDPLPTQAILENCQPIIKKVSGWRDTPIYARSDWWKTQNHPLKELPKPVCELIDIIEHFTGTKVISIGNGPKGDDIIYIKKQEE